MQFTHCTTKTAELGNATSIDDICQEARREDDGEFVTIDLLICSKNTAFCSDCCGRNFIMQNYTGKYVCEMLGHFSLLRIFLKLNFGEHPAVYTNYMLHHWTS